MPPCERADGAAESSPLASVDDALAWLTGCPRRLVRTATVWAHPRRHPARLLLLLSLFSAAKLPIVVARADRITRGRDWDEYHILVSLQHSRGPAAVAGWFHGDWVERNGYYRPLTSLSLWLDYLVWGARHRGFLLTNWLLHCLTAWVLALLAAAVLRNPVAGVLAGSACALARYASTRATLAWMSTRTDVLCGVLCLVALYAAMVWIRRGRWPWLAASCASAAAALLAKEMAAMLTFYLLLCTAITFRRPGWSRTALVVTALAAMTSLWWILYLRFVPEGASHAHVGYVDAWRQAKLVLSWGLPSVDCMAVWLRTGADLPYLLSDRGIMTAVCFLVTALAVGLVLATNVRALWLFAGWEIISCVPLLGVRFATMHYFHIPDLARSIWYGAALLAFLEVGHRVMARRRGASG